MAPARLLAASERSSPPSLVCSFSFGVRALMRPRSAGRRRSRLVGASLVRQSRRLRSTQTSNRPRSAYYSTRTMAFGSSCRRRQGSHGHQRRRSLLVVRLDHLLLLASASGTVASAKQPKDVWFSIAKRARRRMTSFFVLVAMTVLCITSIFFMQLFRSFMQGTEVIIGGSDYSSIIVSIANSTLITTFNMTWRSIAIRLSMWENYRLNERMRENLTYKLFIFQCINCYFMLAYTAFGHPFGVRLFGIDMGKCESARRQASELCG